MLQTAIDNIIFAFGIVFLAYFAARTLTVKPKRLRFSIFWVIAGTLFMSIAILDAITESFVTGFLCCLSMAFLVFIFIGIAIIFFTALTSVRSYRTADPAYIIVLGVFCPSDEFDVRIKATFEYWKSHQSSVIICTGGLTHSGSECEAISAYNNFIRSGVPEDKLCFESTSTCTSENLYHASCIIRNPEADTVIVTSDYHVLRTLIVAHKAGYKNVRALPAFFPGISWINYAVRELLHLPAMLFSKSSSENRISSRKHQVSNACIYLQTDPDLNRTAAWPQESYPQTGHQYFRECGCLVTSLYNMLSICDHSTFPSPWEMNEALKKAGMFYPTANLELSRIHEILSVRYVGRIPYSYNALVRHMDSPDVMFILIVDGIESQHHYVLTFTDESGEIRILDPLSGLRNIENYKKIHNIIVFRLQ